MKRLKTKFPNLVGYADRPLLRGLATPRAAGLDLDKGGGGLLRLFANGEDGFLFGSFADRAKLFTTSAGATNVSANDDPVGRAVESSQNIKNATQATTTKRPIWKSNSGKPYLAFDGTDDFLTVPYIPDAAGTAAVAFRANNLNSTALGGGSGAGDRRLRLGLADTSGRARVVFNTPDDRLLGPAIDKRGSDTLIILTWDVTGWAAYLDGASSPTAAAATVPNMDGTGTNFALGSLEGGVANFTNGALYAALALSRRVTPEEVALITTEFQRTYQ
jgi:hypothetical protein